MVEDADLPPLTEPDPPDKGTEPGPEETIAPGTLIGDDYEIRERIGSGGMGTVYKALKRSLNTIVAVKVLHRAIASSPSMIKRFHREAILAANLNHPNIVRVSQVDLKSVLPFLVMEFVPGISLKDKIEKDGYLQPEEAVRIILQACDALQYAHDPKNSVIHRDIKPDNILLENGLQRVRITDFGIAQDLTGRMAEVTQTEGLTAGTVAFMSPEQNLGQALDARTDIFSLGMTLYYMLTGKTAYRARNRPELALAFRGQVAPPPSRVNPVITRGLDDIVLKMIAPDIAKRYASCDAVAADLRALLPAITAPVQRRNRHTLYALAGLGILAVAVASTFLVLGLAGPRSPTPSRQGGQSIDAGIAKDAPRTATRAVDTPVRPNEFLHDDFSDLALWIYSADSKGAFGTNTNGHYAYVSNWQSGGQVMAERPLARTIRHDDDFAMTLCFGAGPDAPNSVGGLMVSLLDEKNAVVARMGWHDAQAAAGFGGVDFYAEGDVPIYRTDPSGFGKDCPLFNGTIELTRTGAEWTALMNGKQVGSKVTLQPKANASRIRISASRAMGWFPREFEIRELSVSEGAR